MASLEFLEGSSLSDPMEAVCRVTSKNCIQKEYVLAYVWPKTLLCHFNVPDVWLLRGLLWLRTQEEVMCLYACVVAEKDEEVCVVTNKHCVAGISRLHGFHHY